MSNKKTSCYIYWHIYILYIFYTFQEVMWLSFEEIYTSVNQERISNNGGKTASQLCLALDGDGEHMLPFSVAQVEEWWHIDTPIWVKEFFWSIWSRLNIFLPYWHHSVNTPSIFVRPSFYWDHSWGTWLIDSKVCCKIDDLNFDNAYKSIITQSISDRTKDYILKFDNNTNYSWLQTLHYSPLLWARTTNYCLWSIAEHPNMKKKYIIDFLWGFLEYLVDENGKLISMTNLDSKSFTMITQGYLASILRMKHATDELWFIQWKISHTEFAIIGTKDEADYINRSRDFFEYQWKELKKWSIVSLQQREFREYDDYTISENSDYKFNTFGQFPDVNNILDISHMFKKDFDLKIKEPFILDFKHTPGYTSRFHKTSELKLKKLYELINSENLKWIKFARSSSWETEFIGGLVHTAWNSNGSLEHWSYKYLSKDIPIKTEYREYNFL